MYRPRAELATYPGYIRQLLRDGNECAREIADVTLSEVREAMGITY